MARVSLEGIPDDGRVWVFGCSRVLDERETEGLLRQVDEFLDTWSAHGAPLSAGREWRHGRFLLVGLDERSVPPSGCSIDAMVGCLRALGTPLGATFLDNSPVWYHDGTEVQSVSRAEFSARAARGLIGAETTVFDQSVGRLGQVRNGEWERSAGQGWHQSLLPK